MAKKKKTLKSNFRRPTLKAALRYIKTKKEAEEAGTLSKGEELKLVESYRVVYESYESTGNDPEKFKEKKRKAKISKRPDRGNYIGESVAKAKRYLRSVSKYSQEKRDKPQIAVRIAEAQEILRKAELRNQSKRRRRAEKREAKELAKDLSITKWEEVTGPNGDVIRFRLDPFKTGALRGSFRRRVRTNQEPKPGDIVLDITGPTDGNGLGVRAWRITENRRRKHEITTKMVENYKKSILYQVRRMAAGQISLKQLHDFIGKELKKPSSMEYQKDVKDKFGATKRRNSRALKRRRNSR